MFGCLVLSAVVSDAVLAHAKMRRVVLSASRLGWAEVEGPPCSVGVLTIHSSLPYISVETPDSGVRICGAATKNRPPT